MKLNKILLVVAVTCMSTMFIGACGVQQNDNAQSEETVVEVFDKLDLLGTDTNVVFVTTGSVEEGNQCIANSGKSKNPKKDMAGIEAINLNVLGIKNQSNAAPIEGIPGVYNVLADDFISRILAEANLPVGADVHMLRLMLAESGHSVVIEGTEHPLIVPSGVQSGFKLIFKEHDCLIVSDDDLLLVDIQFKLINNPHGYKLRPVAFVYCAHNEDPAIDPDDPCDDDGEEEEEVIVVP